LVAIVAILAFLPASRSRIAASWKHLRSASITAAPRLAVLSPRVDGTSPELTAFADGLSATLATSLSTLSQNHDLRIIDSTRVERARAADPSQAMNALGANLALQLEVQQSAQMNRVVWTLTSAQTGQPVASHTLTAPKSDPFSLEDQVADEIVQALRINLRSDERAALAVHGTTDPVADDYYLQGKGYLERQTQLHAIDNAIQVLNRAIDLDPNFGRAYAARGRAYWLNYIGTKQTTWVDKARDDCSKAVSLGNAGADGHMCIGMIDAGTGQYEQAAEEYQKAVELDPSAERAYVGVADAFTRLNRLSDAEDAYRHAIAANPNSAFVYERLGIFYLQQAQYAKAAETFQKAINLAPESYVHYSNLGAADLYLGDYPAAIAAFEQSLRLRPAPGAYANLGTAYYQSRRFADAASNYQRALGYNQHDPDLWGNLADAYHFSGQQPKALDAYKKQLALLNDQLKVNPRDAQLQGEVASCYASLGDKSQATAHLALSLEYGRGNKDLLFNAAVVYNDLGETGDALEWLHKSLLAGYSASIVRDSPEFDNLRGNPQFEQLLSQSLKK
jgi:serine/threonine-protein kinase